MRWAIGLVILLLLMASCRADETFDREMMFDGLMALDYAQTRSIFASHGRYVELNPAISRRSVGRYFVSTAILHSVITYALPKRYRRLWQFSTITIEAAVVGHNASIGIGLRW